VELSDASCDPSTELCSYEVLDDDLDAECAAITHIDEVYYSDSLVAGGRNGSVVLRTLLSDGQEVALPIEAPFVRALIEADNGYLTGMYGVILGTVRRTVLVDYFRSVPSLAVVGTTEDFVDSLVTWDTDMEGDGVYESASLSLRFYSAPARLRTPDSALTCSELLSCLSACADGDTTCQQNCIDSASPEASQQFWDLANCIQNNCPDGDQSCIGEQCSDEYTSCLFG